MEKKLCSKCGETKPIEEFSKAKTGLFGRRGDCKVCRRKIANAWYSDLGVDGQRTRRAKYAEEKKAYQFDYYRRNRAWLSEYSKQWVADNRDKHRSSVREAMRRKRATVKGRLESNVSRAVNRALRGRKDGEPAFKLLGFTVHELIEHLERQFQPRMSWVNYGKWHVDHIVPLASFEYEIASDPEFARAWAITNLRPLWASENISKGARRLLLI